MTEEQIRAIVRDEIQNELLREGGVCDHTREAAFNMVQPMVEVVGRNLREEFVQVWTSRQ